MSEMSENSNHTATNSPETTNDSAPVSPEELAEVIQEFEQYRQRLVEEMTNAAKKAKLSKSKMMTKLEPELAKIDTALEKLRLQYAASTGK
jgi:molecular chaperone GrpE (heat shock protein)